MALDDTYFFLVTDKMAAGFIAMRGTDASGYGIGVVDSTGRAAKKLSDLQALILESADIAIIEPVASAIRGAVAKCDVYQLAPSVFGSFLDRFNLECAQQGLDGVTDLDSFATYYNIGDGGPWNALMHMDFRELYYACKLTYPTETNVYFEVLQGGSYAGVTFTNALRKSVVTGAGTDNETAGVDIDDTAYAGGLPQLKVSGLTGTGTVAMTGTWRKTDGSIDDGDGTVAVSGNGSLTVTPPFTDALILTCTAVTVPAGISAGTLYVEALRPDAISRANPPT